jgi:serine/threonine protein kinase
MELPTGTIVDNSYRISSPIRLSKDGDVYLGEPIAPGPPVMIHILRTALMEGDPGLEAFERAGLELCRFSHDAFPEVVDYGRFMVRPYLITEKIDGTPLPAMLADMSSERALDIVDGVRQALHAAHEAGMTHGALSADSILVTAEGEVKLVDLFARWVAHQIHSKGAPIDTAADLRALVDINQLMMKSSNSAKEVDDAQVLSIAPADVASDLALEPKKFDTSHVEIKALPTDLQALADEEEEAPKLWEEFTPEPETDIFAAKATIVATSLPELHASPVVMLETSVPIDVKGPSSPQVKLPPPVPTSVAPVVRPMVAASEIQLPPRKPTPKPVAVKLPEPAPMRAPKPRIESFKQTAAAALARVQLDDDPFTTNQLQPGYMGFFKNMFPRGGVGAKSTAENSASRSFNLLITCAVALVMLAMVLRF